MNSNLPPGVSTRNLPGNRPQDEVWESFADWALEELTQKNGLDLEEAKRAVLSGIAGVLATRDAIKEIINSANSESKEDFEIDHYGAPLDEWEKAGDDTAGATEPGRGNE